MASLYVARTRLSIANTSTTTDTYVPENFDNGSKLVCSDNFWLW